jgi:hypothetical protein
VNTNESPTQQQAQGFMNFLQPQQLSANFGVPYDSQASNSLMEALVQQ